MSRLKNFTNSLVSGYIALGANIFYSLASIPLALHYLGKTEFGLWALVAQIGSYLALIDFGMGNSVSRFLIDHKDDRKDGIYGSIIKSSLLVGLAQGIIILLVGVLLSRPLGFLLHVPAPLQREFLWLVIGQSILTGLSFTTRVFSYLIIAHQRMDISNYGYALTFFLNLVGMWVGLEMGWGVYSFLIGLVVMTFGNIVINAIGCVRLFPRQGEWGGVTWVRFCELFYYGRDNFLIGIGWQFISASQTILLTRFLGLDAAAVWSICTRSYGVVTMLIWRVVDFSTPMLVEMMVREETDRLLRRFREITILSSSISVLGAALLAVCNGSFLWLWTGGQIHWAPLNNLLLALSCVVVTAVRPHTMLATQTKQMGLLRFIFLLEGLVFVGLNLLTQHLAGMTTMLVISVLCTLCFTLLYGLRRTQKYFGLSVQELSCWFSPAGQLALRLIPIALGTWLLVRGLPPIWQMTTNLLITGLWGGVMLFKYGLGKQLQIELIAKSPINLRNLLKCI
jgi:O-antigen/teichoic acid export membrane protein